MRMTRLRDFLKAIASKLFERYELQRIYRLDLSGVDEAIPETEYVLRRITQSDVERCPVARIRERAGYGGEHAHGFAVFEGESIVCMSWFWDGERFRDHYLCRPAEREAVMVDLVTVDSHKGRGLAPLLTRFAAAEFKRAGFRTLHTWVWHSNSASIRSFEKAQWTCTAYLVYLKLRGLPAIHFRRKRRVPPAV